MATATTKPGSSKKRKIAVGVGIAVALAAAAAGVYFLYGKGGEKRRKKVKSWMLKMRAEVLEALETARGVLTRENYERIVETVSHRYARMRDVEAEELQALVRELKAHWKEIQSNVSKSKPGGGASRKKAGPSKSKKPTAARR